MLYFLSQIAGWNMNFYIPTLSLKVEYITQ